jgi:hypothetical protein
LVNLEEIATILEESNYFFTEDGCFASNEAFNKLVSLLDEENGVLDISYDAGEYEVEEFADIIDLDEANIEFNLKEEEMKKTINTGAAILK